MIHSLAQKLAENLGENLNADQSQIEVYAYGLEILMMSILNLMTVAILASLIGTLYPTLIFLAVFAMFRCIGGGVHLGTFTRCFIFGTSMMVGLGILSSFNLGTKILVYLFIFVLISLLYSTFKWVPADTVKRPITEEKVRLKQKIYMLAATCLWAVIILILIQRNQNPYALAMLLGAVGSLFLITPWGYRLLEVIDRELDNVFKGGETDV